eukprot:gene9183-6460_t
MFGELVCGPPGSGKTTYCEGKRQFLSVYDPTRPVILLNLDPANEDLFPYPCDVDVRDVVCHEKVMDMELGPNGAYIMCAVILEDNVDWIIEQIEAAARRKSAEVSSLLPASGQPSASPRPPYLIADCPGQVEFYLNSTFIHRLYKALQKQLECNLCTVHLVDAVIATSDVSTFVSACLLSVTTMVDHEQPHINVLSKWDAVHKADVETSAGDPLFFNTSDLLQGNFDLLWKRQLRRRRQALREAQYHVTGAQQTAALDAQDKKADEALEAINLEKDGGRMYRYTKALLDVVDGYGIVGYVPLDVQSQELMLAVTQQVDNAIGFFV